MKTTIDLNNELLEKARILSKIKTKKAVVEFALDSLIKSLMRKEMLDLKGKIKWEGNLAQMRKN